MNHARLTLAMLGALGLAACDKLTAVDMPASAAGATGSAGQTGSTGTQDAAVLTPFPGPASAPMK